MVILKNLSLNLKNFTAMKIKDILIWGTEKLNNSRIDSAYLDAELLLSLILKKDKEFLYTYPDFELNNKQIKKYQKLIKKRATHYPLAYIFGYKEFYGLKFQVNENVLIPRPETELLVEETLKIYKKNTEQKIIEIGTGSGCIATSLVKNGISNIIATDISSKTLKVAKNNAKTHQVSSQIKFIKGSLLKPLKDKKIDVLIANLPYLDDSYQKESSIQYEPNLALYSGKDGLNDYKKLFTEISKLEHQPRYILIELNPKQIKPLSAYIVKLFLRVNIETKKDLQGLERIMVIKLK